MLCRAINQGRLMQKRGFISKLNRNLISTQLNYYSNSILLTDIHHRIVLTVDRIEINQAHNKTKHLNINVPYE